MSLVVKEHAPSDILLGEVEALLSQVDHIIEEVGKLGAMPVGVFMGLEA